jgi:acid phosphatase family membrane protein YuiD
MNEVVTPAAIPVLQGLFDNTIFISALTSWFLAQLIKASIQLIKRSGQKQRGAEIIETLAWRTGGMPSSHSALVAAMATAAGFKDGIQSDIFVVCFFLALIVMRDALGVRRSSGLQARALNHLGRRLAEKGGFEFHPVKEVNGHTPMEVVVGLFLGVFIASALALL